jgi:hypothetical protein
MMAETAFSKAVAKYIDDEDGDVGVAKLCQRFDCPKTTVKRWADGRGAPHLALQKSVLDFIKDRA